MEDYQAWVYWALYPWLDAHGANYLCDDMKAYEYEPEYRCSFVCQT